MLSLADATTRSQSLKLFFLRYFFVRYFRYLLEKGTSEVRAILVFCLSMVSSLPKLLVLPPTLIRSWRYFSKSAQFMIPSSTGWVQSMKSLIWFFLPGFFAAFLAGAIFTGTVTQRAGSLVEVNQAILAW